MWLQFGSVSGTQRILLSSAFSSRMRKSATGLTSMRQAGDVGSGAHALSSGGAPDDAHRVEGVAGPDQRVAKEAVVRRIAQRGEQQPVKLDRPELVVPLVLVRR